MISYGIEKLGFGKWFQDRVDPEDLNRFDIAIVIAVHKDSYTINKGENDVFAELIGKMVFSAASPIDYPAVGDWVFATSAASLKKRNSCGLLRSGIASPLEHNVAVRGRAFKLPGILLMQEKPKRQIKASAAVYSPVPLNCIVMPTTCLYA